MQYAGHISTHAAEMDALLTAETNQIASETLVNNDLQLRHHPQAKSLGFPATPAGGTVNTIL